MLEKRPISKTETLHLSFGLTKLKTPGVGGTAVPPGELSPRTCGTRVRCPPGPLVLGGGVPPLGQMSPPGPLALGSDVPLSGLLRLGSDAPWHCH